MPIVLYLKTKEMKKVTKFNKVSLYSDTDPTNPRVTIFRYIGKYIGKYIFRFIGGEVSYVFTEHPKHGSVIDFGQHATKYELSTEEVQELIKQGKITEQ